MKQNLEVLLSHESMEWYTPPHIIDLVKNVFGGYITLDPASSYQAQKIVQAQYYYTIEDNGLEQKWFGKVFLNPPYSKTKGKSNQEIWSNIAYEKYKTKEIKELVILLKASVGYKWFTNICKKAACVCFLNDLLAFIKTNLTISGKAKLGTALLYFGPNTQEFKNQFKDIGMFVKGE